MLELVFHSYQRLFVGHQAALEENALDDLDFRILYMVHRGLGRSIAGLARELGSSKQTISRHARRLIESDLLVETTSKQDRRSKSLTVSGQAATILKRISENQKRYLRSALKRTGSSAVEGFDDVLSQLCAGSTPT